MHVMIGSKRFKIRDIEVAERSEVGNQTGD